MGVFAGPEIVSDGLVLSLDAGNVKSYPGSGTTWTDLSGNSNTGTLNGSPTFSNGYFDIVSDSTYISIPNSSLIPRTNNFTYSCWINFDTLKYFNTIFENGSWEDCLLLRFEYDPPTNRHEFTVFAEGTLVGVINWTPIIGSWLNIVFKRESNVVSCFVNKNLVGTPISMSLDINLANPNLWLMRSQHVTNQYTDGKISVFSIYNRALTTAEIEQNFNALRGRFGI